MTDTVQPLVAPPWLASALGRPGLVVLDIRSKSLDGGGREAFEAGHIPGSLHSDYGLDGWRAARGQAAGLLPEAPALEDLFGRLGLRPEDHVVIVPAGAAVSDFSGAARVYWTLKVAGHPAASILDGGYGAWAAAGLPVERGAGRAMAPSTHPVRFDERLRARLEDVERAVAGRSAVLVDGRARGFYEGAEKSGQVARAGRLPGAVHVDHAPAYDPQANRLRPAAELERLYASVPAGEAVSYCNTGHLASTNWFILSELLRRPDVRLYDGSMSEWAEDPSRPVETGRSG